MSAEFDAAVFKNRRDRLANEMQDGVAILPSAAVCHRNGDVDHEYRQNSDFFYLTGFEEAGSLALIIKEGDKTQFILFV
ncbi:MAG: aminopeptidase P N-terminal domain-containing protein, partial [Planctomycetes bacterium]|nr:aminopeptidase P N-terminal domain-containing protein [Planctomycetota bacterium]